MQDGTQHGSPELPSLEEQIGEVLDAYESMGDPTAIFHTHRYNAYPEYWQEGVNDRAYIEALAELPTRNPTLGREVYRTFAESTNPRDRSAIVIYLARLCLVDRAAGLELWDHLVRDPGDAVRHAAFREIDREHLEVDPSLDSATYDEEERIRREAIGLTWQDITHLYRVYLRAEAEPKTRYQPSAAPPVDGYPPRLP